MVHGLTSQLGGGMTLQSARGEGTVVELWLRLAKTAATPATLPGREATRPADFALGTALLVDDEELVRMSTADMLADLGYAVVEAASAEQALAMLNDGLHADVLVTDHLMPGMNGAELTRAARTLRPRLPVLIVSGYAETDGLPPALPRLTKPFRMAELATVLNAVRTVPRLA